MSENHSKLEMALMELDKAVTGLAKQADGVKKTIQAVKTRPAGGKGKKQEPDLFSMLSVPTSASVQRQNGEADFDFLERKLDAAITQIEDLLSEDSLVAGHG